MHGQANIRQRNACPNIVDAWCLKVKIIFVFEAEYNAALESEN